MIVYWTKKIKLKTKEENCRKLGLSSCFLREMKL